MVQSRPLFADFKYKLIKALMVCLGLEAGAGGLKAQTNPLSYVRGVTR